MTVNQLAKEYNLSVLSMPNGDREVQGGYVGDLLSWVMGRAQADQAWITIMSNINIVAVASLSDVSCIILSEGVTIEQDIIDTAIEKDVNILSTDLSSFEIASLISKSL